MRIIHRMIIAFGCVLAIGILQTGASLVGIHNIASRIDEASVNPLKQVDAARSIWDAYGDAKAELVSALNAVRFEPSEDVVKRFNAHLGRIEQHLQTLKASGPSADLARRLGDTEQHIREWSKGALTLLGDKPTLSIPAPYKMERLESKLRPDLQALVDLARSDAARSVANMRSQSQSVQWLIVICALVATAVGAGLAAFASLSLTRPLTRVQMRMHALMNGDIQSVIPERARADEIGQIAKTVEFMQGKLVEREQMEKDAALAAQAAEVERARTERETIERERNLVNTSIGAAIAKLAQKDLSFRLTEPMPEAYAKLQSNLNSALELIEEAMQGVTERAAAIGATTHEMSGASNDLSRRTEQQAASLEQTAAALDQITATVKKTAENAGHARDVVCDAKKNAEATGDVVRKTTDAMGGIEKSSQQINTIIGVIDEIAFQTNLLALNAGVEAARAGDSGRGFAVVASEVRALAQRSAQAAKEIKELISRSSAQVQSGVVLVAQTGSSLELMIRQVSEISDAITTIASGAQEQATGIQEVNTAINQMDQATQQNAAMVEQTTAASSTLADETSLLQSGIAQFKVSNRAGAAAAPQNVRPILRKASPAPRAKPAGVAPRSKGATAYKLEQAPAEAEWEEF